MSRKEFLQVHKDLVFNPLSTDDIKASIRMMCDVGVQIDIQQDILLIYVAELFIIEQGLHQKTAQEVEAFLAAPPSPFSREMAFAIGILLLAVIFMASKFLSSTETSQESKKEWLRFQIAITLISAVVLTSIFLYHYVPYFTKDDSWVKIAPVPVALAIIGAFNKSILWVLEDLWSVQDK